MQSWFSGEGSCVTAAGAADGNLGGARLPVTLVVAQTDSTALFHDSVEVRPFRLLAPGLLADCSFCFKLIPAITDVVTS